MGTNPTRPDPWTALLLDINHNYTIRINANKSSVFFSRNTPEEVKGEVMSTLGPMSGSRHTKYLGLPSIIGKSKIEVFAEI